MADQSTINTGSTFFDRTAEFRSGVAGLVATLGRGFGSGIKKMQYSRMVSVLKASSDSQLEAIGITRADIPRHAAYLVDYEYDGL